MQTTTTIDGVLSTGDHKGHVPLRFQVPPGTTRLEAVFTAEPERATGALFDNLISLAVEAPGGWRGARHNNPDRTIRLDAGAATPGFMPGPIEPGTWTVWLDVFRLLGPDPVRYRLEVTMSGEAVAASPLPGGALVHDRGPGWYRGDLHAHTLHSDGDWDVAGLIAFARAQRLDFLTLTDHNTVSGIAELERLAAGDILPMGGVELTTHFGHALVLGTRAWEEWRANSMAGVAMPALCEARTREGKLFVIAHPMSPGDPACTGCRWDYADMRPGPADAVEIWNGPWCDYNEDGLAIFRDWLTQTWQGEGRRLVATAGTDIHGPDDAGRRHGFNLVRAAGLSEAAILAGIAAGRNILTAGPSLAVSATGADGAKAGVGDVIEGRTAELRVAAPDAPAGATLRVVQDGTALWTGAGAGASLRLSADRPSWIMVELRDADGAALAIANPIFLAP